jgi:hypothetical protein
MIKIKNLFSFLKLDFELIHDKLTLLIYLIFSIIIITDIVAFFMNKNLEFLVILTLLSGSLVAYSQAWYYGNANSNNKKIEYSNRLKPEVRIIQKPMTQEEYQGEATKEMDNK